MDPPAARALADRLSAEDGSLPAVSGEAGTVAALAGAWATARRVPVHPVAAQRLYRLAALRAPRPVAGRARPATSDDVPTVMAWDKAFAVETGLDGPDGDDRLRTRRRGPRLPLHPSRALTLTPAGRGGRW